MAHTKIWIKLHIILLYEDDFIQIPLHEKIKGRIICSEEQFISKAKGICGYQG